MTSSLCFLVIRYSITLEPTIETGIRHIVKRLAGGAELLQEIHDARQNGTAAKIPDIPGAFADDSFEHAAPPLAGDK